MWKEVISCMAVVQLIYGASLIPCPNHCHCQNVGESLHATCDSLNFLNKLISKQYSSITKLKINATSIEHINPKLKYLKNLEHLDISHTNVMLSGLPNLLKLKTLNLRENNLKDIKLSTLPENLEDLDLSYNYLSQIPKDWSHLKHLKTIYLANNPINCDCSSILLYKEIKKHNIQFPGKVLCSSPKEYNGKLIESIDCSPLDTMLGDEEGSGAPEAEEEEEEDVDSKNVPLIEDDYNDGSHNSVEANESYDDMNENQNSNESNTDLEDNGDETNTGGDENNLKSDDVAEVTTTERNIADSENKNAAVEENSAYNEDENNLEAEEENVPLIENEDIPVDNKHNNTLGDVFEEEGSGFSSNEDSEYIPHEVAVDTDTVEAANETESEGSGAGFLLPDLPDLPKACITNCSEPKPVGAEDEEDASPLPNFQDQIDILSNDLDILKLGRKFRPESEEVPKEPENVKTDEQEEEIKTEEEPNVKTEVEEIPILKESDTKLEKTSDKDNYTLTSNTKLGRSSVGGESNSDTVYIIIGVLVLGLICILIFFIKRRGRNNGNRRKQIPVENFGEELKPLGKSVIKPLNEKPGQMTEHVPLMNGNNGKAIEEAPELPKIELPDSDLEFNEVELRSQRDNEELLTPKRERVTIKETELPDSIPKTPLLVHREKNSEGEIVLTPVDNK